MTDATNTRFICLAIGLSLLIHAALLLGCFFFWHPEGLLPNAYYEIELAAQPEPVVSQPATPLPEAAVIPMAPDAATAPDRQRILPAEAATATGPSPAAKTASSPKPQTAANAELSEQGDAPSPGMALVPPRVREKPASVPTPPIGVKGTVVLTAEILADGRIGRLTLARSSGSAALDAAAREYVARWHFDAARMPPDGKPVRSLTSVWVRYD